MSFGWRVSQRFLNGLMLAVYVMLAACVPIDETFDYRYAALQSGYSPFIAATQNQPSTLDGSRIAPDQTDIINLAASQSSTAITQPDKPHKNDLLTKMEISLAPIRQFQFGNFTRRQQRRNRCIHKPRGTIL